jgi:hypothetical protein
LRTNIEHWGGKRWNIQPSQNFGGHDVLVGVAATSSSSAWAVGYHDGQSLIEHLGGKRWKIQPSPSRNT